GVRTYTTLSLSIRPGAAKITATGTLTPAVPGGKVTATLSRKSGRRFLKVASKTASVDASGDYSAGFRHPVADPCRIKVRYGGDSQHQPSSKTKTFAR